MDDEDGEDEKEHQRNRGDQRGGGDDHRLLSASQDTKVCLLKEPGLRKTILQELRGTFHL